MLIIPLLLISAQAFAWKGDGKRPPTDPKIPADVSKSSKTDVGDGNVIVEGKFSNRTGSKYLICDIIAEVLAKRGGDETLVKAFVDKRKLKPYREFSDRFLFELAEYGAGYKLDKKTQKYSAACLEVTEDETPDQVPPPHDQCDPEWEDCDWTCKADQNKPDQCDNPSQDW